MIPTVLSDGARLIHDFAFIGVAGKALATCMLLA